MYADLFSTTNYSSLFVKAILCSFIKAWSLSKSCSLSKVCTCRNSLLGRMCRTSVFDPNLFVVTLESSRLMVSRNCYRRNWGVLLLCLFVFADFIDQVWVKCAWFVTALEFYPFVICTLNLSYWLLGCFAAILWLSIFFQYSRHRGSQSWLTCMPLPRSL